MKKEWKAGLLGLTVGILVMLVINRSINISAEKPEENTEMRQEEQKQADSLNWEEIANKEVTDKEIKDEKIVGKGTVNEAAVNQAATDQGSDGYYISEHVQIPINFTEQILLYEYIEYGIRKYNEANDQTDTYSCKIEEDILPFDTELCMADTGQEPFKTDLAKEIIPELANNIYNFRLWNQDNTMYMSIDTYNMKIYVYDAIAQ